MLRASAVAVVCALLLAGAAAQITLPAATSPTQTTLSRIPLPYKPDALEPAIDTLTMNLHWGRHYQVFFTNLNTALANRTDLRALGITGLVKAVGGTTLPAASARLIRNNAGGAWNHAQYWKIMAPVGSAATKESAISPALRAAITSSFGSVDAARTALSDAGTKVFGSGWSWLCYTGKSGKPLAVVTSPNQDNPLMGALGGLISEPGCTPILGIDVWEHAYYKKHGPGRAAYLSDWWTVVNWQQVSKNYASAMAGKPEEIGQP